MKELHEIAKEVVDQETFLVFVRALYKDRELSIESESKLRSSPYEADVGGWENTNIETFFEAAVAWAEDSSLGTRMASPEYELDGKNPWRSFAAFFWPVRFMSNTQTFTPNKKTQFAPFGRRTCFARLLMMRYVKIERHR